ncbi:hypothetical protein CI41S_56430 [Bradyrhizobium ivorense]|nr:hypothetical protein CI41S_56430 [Bradyrhizobium ivorense]
MCANAYPMTYGHRLHDQEPVDPFRKLKALEIVTWPATTRDCLVKALLRKAQLSDRPKNIDHLELEGLLYRSAESSLGRNLTQQSPLCGTEDVCGRDLQPPLAVTQLCWRRSFQHVAGCLIIDPKPTKFRRKLDIAGVARRPRNHEEHRCEDNSHERHPAASNGIFLEGHIRHHETSRSAFLISGSAACADDPFDQTVITKQRKFMHEIILAKRLDLD